MNEGVFKMLIFALIGIDGSGKSGLIEEVAQRLKNLGKVVDILTPLKSATDLTIIKETYLQKFGEPMSNTDIGQILAFDLYLQSEYLKTKDDVDIVLLDRWSYCHEAYCYATMQQNKTTQVIIDCCIEPHKTFYIAVNEDTAMIRLTNRPTIKVQENKALLKRANRKYKKIVNSKSNIYEISNEDGEFDAAVECIVDLILQN